MRKAKSEVNSLLTDPRHVPALIANGQSLSAGIELNSTLVGIFMPAAWTAAGITFQVALDDGTEAPGAYQDLYGADGVEYTVTAAASHFIAIDMSKFIGAAWLKVRSGTGASAVNQGADRTLQLVTRVV